ncbi:hypothetical protein C7N43_21305 [Sphingobacteriales bacterium UPWRP_1]|nr:hypothetical protein B6N25_01400 [Sphingobacteriales bacterium TSM_CSS]PSJ74951.1 hypothetical protein C7N43_21305 [Sphingobacteriales bacterium UPWRP_1]
MFSGRFMIDSSLTTFHSYFASITSLGVTSEIHVFSSDTVGGDYGISEFISTDFGFAATGNISPDFIDSGISAIFLAIDPALNVANFTDIGISDVNDCGYSIAQNEESNFFIGGYYMPTFLTPLREKLYLTKVSPSGEKLWEYTNWSYPYNCSFRAVLPAPDGGCYAAGYIGYNVPSTGDFVLVKLNSNGTEVWAKIFDFDGSDFAVGLIKTPDNCLMLCGQSGIYKAHLMKVALNGDTIWNKQYFPNEDRSGFLKVASMPNNTFVAIGSIKSNDDPDMDLLITKVDSVGNIRWVRRYGSPFYHDYGYDFTPVPQPLGGFVVVGRSDTIVPTSTPGVYLTLGRGYIVKTNCMGLLTLPQAAFTISQDSNLPARFLFTNQSQYAYPDSIDGGY